MKKKSPALPEVPSLSSEMKASAAKPTRRRALREATPDPELVGKHLQEREEAFYAVHHWRGKELFPMTRGRSSQFYKLRLADDAPAIRDVLRGHHEAFLGDALRILYLCSHEQNDWAILRSNSAAFLQVIEQWADENVSKDEEKDVIKLALRIFNESGVQQAEVQPTEGATRQGE